LGTTTSRLTTLVSSCTSDSLQRRNIKSQNKKFQIKYTEMSMYWEKEWICGWPLEKTSVVVVVLEH
jgi:hypothetical protein